MIDILRKFLQHGAAKEKDDESKLHGIDFCDRRIAELQRDYAELIGIPYQAKRLTEIVAELGRIWNLKLQFEEINSQAKSNGAGSLWRVQNDVSDIVGESKQQIAEAREPDDRLMIFLDGLQRLRNILDEWETGD